MLWPYYIHYAPPLQISPAPRLLSPLFTHFVSSSTGLLTSPARLIHMLDWPWIIWPSLLTWGNAANFFALSGGGPEQPVRWNSTIWVRRHRSPLPRLLGFGYRCPACRRRRRDQRRQWSSYTSRQKLYGETLSSLGINRKLVEKISHIANHYQNIGVSWAGLVHS